MVFTNIREVRAAANKHSITECKDLKFKKNEAKRFRALREMRATIREDIGTDVYQSICARAKKLVLQKTQGCYVDEFGILWTYAEEMRKADPGTTVKIKVDRLNPENKPLFQHMYVGFASLRRGFLQGCRQIIGLDGCILKGLCKGELLLAIGRDANDQMYPIAWAVVEVESKDSWSWFLELLASDLSLGEGSGWSISSEPTKGIDSSNSKSSTSSRASSLCTTYLLQLEEETFNASIVEARHKPPYSLLDDIRVLTMERIAKKQEAASKWTSPFCPKIMKKLETNAKESRICRIVTCGNNEYEVNHGDERYKLRLGAETCSCRAWDLSGIRCPHAITCLVYEGKDPVDYISNWYSVAKYSATYSNTMPGMDGPRQWVPVNLDPIQPPPFRAMPGRPKKKRRLSVDEILQKDKKNPHKLSRVNRIIFCSKCKQSGHNSRTCPTKNAPPVACATSVGASQGPTGPSNGTVAQTLTIPAGRGRGRGRGRGSSRGRGR
ncbi:unnamed protein product [Linum trigynum]|uniref:SWIM-type domain-containing protein n=1 Tax=Linum trigynum TaxID=586398 RepID=A0AAV2E6C6_9ROSI